MPVPVRGGVRPGGAAGGAGEAAGGCGAGGGGLGFGWRCGGRGGAPAGGGGGGGAGRHRGGYEDETAPCLGRAARCQRWAAAGCPRGGQPKRQPAGGKQWRGRMAFPFSLPCDPSVCRPGARRSRGQREGQGSAFGLVRGESRGLVSRASSLRRTEPRRARVWPPGRSGGWLPGCTLPRGAPQGLGEIETARPSAGSVSSRGPVPVELWACRLPPAGVGSFPETCGGRSKGTLLHRRAWLVPSPSVSYVILAWT